MKILMIGIMVTLVSCATSQQIIKDQGYSDQDTALVKPYYEKYVSRLITSNIKAIQARKDLKTVFCRCAKELKEKCELKSSDTIQNKELWAKARGAYEAIERINTGEIITPQNELQVDYCEA